MQQAIVYLFQMCPTAQKLSMFLTWVIHGYLRLKAVSITYNEAEDIFPFPGAASNFVRHLSSCLNRTIASVALGAP